MYINIFISSNMYILILGHTHAQYIVGGFYEKGVGIYFRISFLIFHILNIYLDINVTIYLLIYVYI